MRRVVLVGLIGLVLGGCERLRQRGGDDDIAGDRDACKTADAAFAANDYDKARAEYAKCLADGPGHVDTHLRYQRILTLEGGEKDARRTYERLIEKNRATIPRFAHARVLEREHRIAALEVIVREEPEFAPAYYELSLDYSEKRHGTRSLADKAREKKHLEAFLARAQGKAFAGLFVDYDEAEKLVADARERLAKLDGLDLDALDDPVTMTAMPSNAGWMLTFQIAEPTKAVYYRLHDEKDFSPVTGHVVSVPLQKMTTEIEIKYEDATGTMRGPFTIVHEPRSALAESQRKILEQMPTAWVSLRDWDEKTLLYWTTLRVYRCALDEVRYGVDTMHPDQTYDPGECDPKNPFAVTTDDTALDTTLLFAELARETKFVSIQLVFHGGDESKIQRFDK